jgi:hypothetical protein
VVAQAFQPVRFVLVLVLVIVIVIDASRPAPANSGAGRLFMLTYFRLTAAHSNKKTRGWSHRNQPRVFLEHLPSIIGIPEELTY